MEKLNSYNIFEIHNNSLKVILPSIQRGFVWKTDQMCYLWDSLLRGYPIGSFLAAKNGDVVELLDGQQRMTTILSGFYNPFSQDGKSIFSLNKPPVIWIDLQPVSKPRDNVFSILICNQSHPWGYRAENPRERISTGKIRKFLDVFEINSNDYYQLLPKRYFPIDATYPIPLSFLLESYAKEDTHDLRILNLKKMFSNLEYTKVDYTESVDLDTILYNLMEAVELAKNVYVPELLIDLLKVKLTDEETVDEDSRDPTLFVRLNQNGTNIEGDELIYSYYKSFFPKAKLLIESIGNGYISPKMVLNVFSRLAYFLIDSEQDNYRKSFSLEGFKNAFQKNNDFKNNLIRLLPEGYSDLNDSASDKLNAFIEMFKSFERDECYKIPNTLIKVFISDVNLVYIFLCFLEKVSKSKVEIGVESNKKIVSLFIYIHLFSIKKTKIYKPLFEQLVKEYNGEEVDVFIKQVFAQIQYEYKDESSAGNFEHKTFRIHSIEAIMKNIIDNKYSIHSLELFRNLCNGNQEFKKSFYLNGDQNDIFIRFIDRLRTNKEILLLAQRFYINTTFIAFDSIDILEDTNRPWDYDHIYPRSWVYSNDGQGRAINNIHWLVKEWVNTNGNYRALDFSTNRSDGANVAPMNRLEDEKNRRNSFVDDQEYQQYWKCFDKKHLIINNDDKMLLLFLKAVLTRTTNIYGDINRHFLKIISND